MFPSSIINNSRHSPLSLYLNGRRTVREILISQQRHVRRRNILTNSKRLTMTIIRRTTTRRAEVRLRITTPRTALSHSFPRTHNTRRRHVIQVLRRQTHLHQRPLQQANYPRRRITISRRLRRPPPGVSSVASTPVQSGSSNALVYPTGGPDHLTYPNTNTSVTIADAYNFPTLTVAGNSPLAT